MWGAAIAVAADAIPPNSVRLLIIVSSPVRALLISFAQSLPPFTAARRGRPGSISFGSFCAIASGGENRRALGEKGVDALFDIGTGEDPMAVGERAVDRLLCCLVQGIAHAR